MSRRYLAAINVDEDGEREGSWYTTITEDAEEHLAFGDFAFWSDITTYGEHIQVATSWAQLI